MKTSKNSKVKVWYIIASTGDLIGEFSFYREEIKAYFPSCRIVKDKVYLA